MKYISKINKLNQPKNLIQVAENIYRLVVRYPFGMGEVNCYLFEGEKGYTVIDTGSYAKTAIETWEEIIASGIVIDKVVLTHAHIDHMGLAKWFQERYHIPVYLSRLGFEEIHSVLEDSKREKGYAFLKKHGGPEISKDKFSMDTTPYNFKPDGFFDDSQNIQLGNDVYKTIWTPGHSPDHFSFYHQDKQLMVIGDHVLKNISPVIEIWSEDEGNPLKSYFESLERIKAFPTALALPGHGEVIVNLNDRVDEILSRHLHRLEQTLKAVKEEEKTSAQVCQEIYGDLGISVFFSPLMSTITRFIYLESVGKVKSENKNGQIMYRAI